MPTNKNLEELLNDECPASMMWHVCFDKCNPAEEAAAENELKVPQDVSWEAGERPSLESLDSK